MPTISDFLQQDHRELDARFALAEQQVQSDDWDAARINVLRFARALREHIAMEQELLFPALAQHADVSGPCHVMRLEHDQIHGLLESLYTACRDREKPSFTAASKQLRQLLSAHNSKEENILYPLADRVLQARASELIADMRGRRAETGGCGGGRCGCGHAT